MGALDRFLGGPKEVEIDGKKITLKPILVKDMVKVSKTNPTPEESMKISRDMLKLSIDDVSDEDIDRLPLDTYIKLLTEINKLNGFENEQTGRIRDIIEQRKAGK